VLVGYDFKENYCKCLVVSTHIPIKEEGFDNRSGMCASRYTLQNRGLSEDTRPNFTTRELSMIRSVCDDNFVGFCRIL
jgi:hypothetical protein